jgi:hypothetical protein
MFNHRFVIRRARAASGAAFSVALAMIAGAIAFPTSVAESAASTSSADQGRMDSELQLVSSKLAMAKGVEREIWQMEQKYYEAYKKRDAVALRALYTDKAFDIHASGWIYTPEEITAIAANGGKGRGDSKNPGSLEARKALHKNDIGWRVIMQGNDMALVNGIHETYLEIPNPQELARKAGTMLNDPQAQARASMKVVELGFGPGDSDDVTPYLMRNQETRVWVRDGGSWKIALHQATRVGERAQFRGEVVAGE